MLDADKRFLGGGGRIRRIIDALDEPQLTDHQPQPQLATESSAPTAPMPRRQAPKVLLNTAFGLPATKAIHRSMESTVGVIGFGAKYI